MSFITYVYIVLAYLDFQYIPIFNNFAFPKYIHM